MALLLFAETPRFSNEGHRFLVPEGNGLSESLLGAFARAAYQNKPGANYLGASRQATQALENGTVRVGSELLVLAGLDVARLTLAQALAAQRWLHARLEGLGDVEPAKSGRRLVIERPMLNQWLDDPQLAQLPTTDWEGGPREIRSTHGDADSRPGLGRTVLLVLVASHLAALLLGVKATSLRSLLSPSGARAAINQGELRPGGSVVPGIVPAPADSSPPAASSDRSRPPGSPPEGALRTAKANFSDATAGCLGEQERSELLALFPSSQGGAYDDLVNRLIAVVDGLSQERERAEAPRLIRPVLTLPLPPALNDSLVACLRRLNQALDDSDHEMYEKIRSVTNGLSGRERWIEDYLRSAPRKFMAADVERYRKWLYTTPSLEILEIGPREAIPGAPTSAPCTVAVRIGRRKLTLDQVPTAMRLAPGSQRVPLGVLDDDPWNKPIELEISLAQETALFTGGWQLTRNAAVDESLTLSHSKGILGRAETLIRFRVPELANVPTLPPWKEPDETSVPDRRDTAGR